MSSSATRVKSAPRRESLESEPVAAWQTALAVAGIGYAGWKWADNKYNLAADIHTIKGAARAMGPLRKLLAEPGASMLQLWYMNIETPGRLQKPMFIDAITGRQTTFGEVESLSNQIGNWAVNAGFRKGQVISLMMDNRAEYIATWLGLAKVGIVSALINTNIKGKPLVHSITSAECVGAIFGSEHLEEAALAAEDLRENGVQTLLCFSHGSTVAAPASLPSWLDASLDEAIAGLSAERISDDLRSGIPVGSTLYYIYTSGTTGLPKPCKISHIKWMNFSGMLPWLDCSSEDVVYGSGLPFYHSGANLGVNHTVRSGSTLVVRQKFTATQHWDDCAKHGCTVMQYIGELGRYLVAQPKKDTDTSHKLRIAVGNGLRPEIWNEFQRRFNIPEIGEFYGATEGNGGCINHCRNYEGQGAVGRAGALMLKMRPMNIVKFDVEAEMPIRNKDGFCIECDFNEPGELISPIMTVKTADGEVDDFEGYTSKEATEKKIARDVFVKGDKYFRTGDLLRKDSKGFFYFVDRIGDTFRWKGENVSTMEVSEVLSTFPGVVDANVYGVEVPGKDGRACMVAMTLEEGVELDAANFATYCRANLPSYSIPIFIRFLEADINLTGTLKHQKVDYRNQGCDPSKVSDKMWWYNTSATNFEPYGDSQFAEIKGGQARL